ncbi:MAG: hypothetical protein LQ347_005774 [Umbilicaria vellea]|nr:MAG: hypothetical protein LQ347_005774 [Umbilicaria vellea]
MPILEVHDGQRRQLQDIANSIARAKKIAVVAGAGISTNCGIPVRYSQALLTASSLGSGSYADQWTQDFRSENGLYSLIQSQHHSAAASSISSSSRTSSPSDPSNLSLPHQTIKGKDLFDCNIWKDPLSTSTFYKFISSFRQKIREEVKTTSPTHKFIRTLRDTRKLVRCYTQNIDGLEAREGLCTDMARGKGNRARFKRKVLERPRSTAPILPESDRDGGCEVVQLHGELSDLRCTLCQKTCSWEEGGLEATLLSGEAPSCRACLTADRSRRDRGKRGTAVGKLRPNIVLYGEEHPCADLLSAITTHDLGLAPDVLLVLGTSLRVHGLKVLVKEFAKAVHAKAGGKGKVVFVNLSKPAESVWNGVIDYHVAMDCDAWVGDLRIRRPDVWQQQGELELQVSKNVNARQAKRTGSSKGQPHYAAEEDKENTQYTYSSFNPDLDPSQPIRQLPAPLSKPLKRTHPSPPTETPRKRIRQLPTPPSSSHKPLFSPPLLFTLDSNPSPSTPSKRRKPTIAVWEDADSSPRHEIPDSEEDKEAMLVFSPARGSLASMAGGRKKPIRAVVSGRKRKKTWLVKA